MAVPPRPAPPPPPIIVLVGVLPRSVEVTDSEVIVTNVVLSVEKSELLSVEIDRSDEVSCVIVTSVPFAIVIRLRYEVLVIVVVEAVGVVDTIEVRFPEEATIIVGNEEVAKLDSEACGDGIGDVKVPCDESDPVEMTTERLLYSDVCCDVGEIVVDPTFSGDTTDVASTGGTTLDTRTAPVGSVTAVWMTATVAVASARRGPILGEAFRRMSRGRRGRAVRPKCRSLLSKLSMPFDEYTGACGQSADHCAWSCCTSGIDDFDKSDVLLCSTVIDCRAFFGKGSIIY